MFFLLFLLMSSLHSGDTFSRSISLVALTHSSSSREGHCHERRSVISAGPVSDRDQLVDGLLSRVAIGLASAVFSLAGNTAAANADSSDIEPVITDKVFLDVKIANYTEESVGTNKGALGSGRIVLGLYGKECPRIVNQFLEVAKSEGLETSPFPSFYNALFSRVTEQGLLQVEKLRGLNTVQLAGQEQYEWRGNILPYTPILETNKLSHDRAGLLSRQQLTAGPEFSLTLRPNPELDAFHVVFGRVLEGEEILAALAAVPTYTYTTKTGYAGGKKGIESGVADAWFGAQKSLFVGAGKAAGDLRAVDRRGQLLRRITIKKAGVIK